MLKAMLPKDFSLQNSFIAVDGNSISTEVYGNPGYVRALCLRLNSLGYNVTFDVSQPVSGQTTIAMINDGAATIDPLLKPTLTNILIINEGGNDIYYGATPEQAERRMRDYCLARKLAGWFVVVIDTWPRGNGYPPGNSNTAQYAAAILEYNKLVRCRWNEYANLYFDARLHVPEIQPNTAYMTAPDVTHPNTDGCCLIGSRLADFLVQQVG